MNYSALVNKSVYGPNNHTFADDVDVGAFVDEMEPKIREKCDELSQLSQVSFNGADTIDGIEFGGSEDGRISDDARYVGIVKVWVSDSEFTVGKMYDVQSSVLGGTVLVDFDKL